MIVGHVEGAGGVAAALSVGGWVNAWRELGTFSSGKAPFHVQKWPSIFGCSDGVLTGRPVSIQVWLGSVMVWV